MALAFLATLTGKILAGVVVVVAGLAATGGFLFAIDYGVEATVVRKTCPLTPPTVEFETKLFGISGATQISRLACTSVQPGNFVEYHIRTGRTVIYGFEGGPCIYDTGRGLC